ncbi:Cytochrome b/b6 domain [Desulfurispirillum indicum S5]|uniref:Cytochrome b/b6 domain n=1 Tax=Desulfurispirillum indicum (strain ATCC BAA-1389 / DSM 22839 / S5) TaxID=653733 RepID=E6W6H9_DESIS|nr:cytochrome b N-terminal domain-containing protein [Desulfurispirillum indicum]ADU67314.1 Cytochrome b/b6 domain [Desulfurispirillum indicum S5]
MKVHEPLKDFLVHLFPRVVIRKNLRIQYTFCLGGLALTSFLMLLFSGFLLVFYYQPTSEGAYASILFLEEHVSGGKFIRSLHRMSSHALLILIFLHTLRVILTGAYRPPRQMNWLIGFALLCLALFAAYTGYLLPMDQLALWATQTGMELVAIVPGGGYVRDFLLPDGIGGTLSILRFYALHIVVLPVLMIILCALHFYRIRKDKGLLPYL